MMRLLLSMSTFLIILSLIPDGAQANHLHISEMSSPVSDEIKKDTNYDEKQMLIKMKPEDLFKIYMKTLSKKALIENLLVDEDDFDESEVNESKRQDPYYDGQQQRSLHRQQAARWNIGFGKRSGVYYKPIRFGKRPF
jgi:hypothetical protein